MSTKSRGFFEERPLPIFEVDSQLLHRRTRRDLLLFGAGTLAALAGARSLLPHALRVALRIDDEVVMVPVKLGLKNVKAVTGLTYVAQEPRDYWAERGYSHYDGI